jgi:hypothetical protein
METPSSQATAQGRYEPIASVLISCELSRVVVPEGQKEEDAKPFYTVYVDLPTRDDELSLGFCNLSVGKRLGEVSIIELTAVYLFGFTSNDDLSNSPDYSAILERLVRGTVWPRFRDLFALVINQADVDLPALPSDPGRITIAELEKTSAV